MQTFIAVLSNSIGKAEFEQSWQSTSGDHGNFTIDFHFDDHRVLITIESYFAESWRSDDFHRKFSTAVHRVDSQCNIRWL